MEVWTTKSVKVSGVVRMNTSSIGVIKTACAISVVIVNAMIALTSLMIATASASSIPVPIPGVWGRGDYAERVLPSALRPGCPRTPATDTPVVAADKFEAPAGFVSGFDFPPGTDLHTGGKSAGPHEHARTPTCAAPALR